MNVARSQEGKRRDLESGIRQMLTVLLRKRQVHSYREKDREDKACGGVGELVLLLLWPPSPLLAGPLEVFQSALLYLIKASQAPGSAPRPAIFPPLPSNLAWNFKAKGCE